MRTLTDVAPWMNTTTRQYHLIDHEKRPLCGRRLKNLGSLVRSDLLNLDSPAACAHCRRRALELMERR